jgi:protein O-GlcNAc transferase
MTNLELCFHLEDTGRIVEAEQLYRKLLAEEPSNPILLHNIGRLYRNAGDIDNASTAFSMLDTPAARNALGHIRMDQGRTVEAIEIFKSLPNQSDYLFAACHAGDADAAHAAFGASCKVESKVAWPTDGKIGWISPNFRQHTVPKFLRPVLDENDYFYSDVVKPDAKTAEFQAAYRNWRDTSGWTDAQLVEQLRADGISHVVDLTGHMDGGKRAAMFGSLPTSYNYIGYCRGSGIPQQIRITDDFIDPRGKATTESLLRVPGGCYGYCGDDSLAAATKAMDSTVVYGSLNRPAKFTDELLTTWAKIINARSCVLRLLVPGGENSISLRKRVEAAGVPADKLQLVPTGGAEHYHGFIRSLDFVLDSFAYSGMTTTADALWLGVPVITLAGATPQSRVGASLLTNVVPHWIANSVEEYVALALDDKHFDDRHWLRGMALREKMKAGNLCNGSIGKRLRLVLLPSSVRAPRDKGTRSDKGCGCGRAR